MELRSWVFLPLLLCAPAGSRAEEGRGPGVAVASAGGRPALVAVTAPAEVAAPSASRVRRGRAVYERFCVSCHGEQGDGRGYSAPWLDPRPRDFTRGLFKWRSTPSGALPTEADLLRTVRRGLYHTNMPSWGVLADADLEGVVEYLKTFSPRWRAEPRAASIEVPAEPADTAASRERGRALYHEKGCTQCHGESGKGDGPASEGLLDDWGRRIVPFDFTGGARLKAGDEPADLYRVFMTGLNGTPMPSFADNMTPDEAWALVHFLRALRAEDPTMASAGSPATR